MKQATAPSICRKNPLLHFLLHEIQTRAGLDAFGSGLFVDDSIEIRRHFLLYDLLDGFCRIVRLLRVIDQRVKRVNVFLRDFFLCQKLRKLLL